MNTEKRFDVLLELGMALERYILENPDRILEAQGLSVEEYIKLLNNADVHICLQMRALAVIAKTWDVSPASDSPRDKEIAAFVAAVLRGFDMELFLQNLLTYAQLCGYAVCQATWKYIGDKVGIKNIFVEEPQYFVFTRDGELRLNDGSAEGRPLSQDRQWGVLSYGANNTPYGRGLGPVLWYLVKFQKQGLVAFARFIERFGIPWVTVRMPQNPSENLEDTTLARLKSLVSGGLGTHPDGSDLKVHEVDAKGEAQRDFQDIVSKLISRVILSQHLTTDIGPKGSYAAATVHNQVRQDLVEYDCRRLEAFMNRENSVVRWIVDLNFTDTNNYPTFIIHSREREDLNAVAERLLKLYEMGLPIPYRYVNDTLAIPEPKGDEPVLIKKEPTQSPSDQRPV